MGLPHATSFCWCIGLEGGAITIAVLHLIVSLILMILCSMFTENMRANIGTVEDVDGLYTTWYKIGVAVAVMSVVHVLLASTLLYGARKRNVWCVRVWAYVMTALYVIAVCYVLISRIMFGVDGTGIDIFLAMLEGLLFFGAVGYCIFCVYSYYLMLQSSEDMRGPYGTEY